MGCEVPIDSEERVSLLEPLSRDKSPGVRSKFSEAWQEVVTVVEQLRHFGAKDNVSPSTDIVLWTCNNSEQSEAIIVLR